MGEKTGTEVSWADAERTDMHTPNMSKEKSIINLNFTGSNIIHQTRKCINDAGL